MSSIKKTIINLMPFLGYDKSREEWVKDRLAEIPKGETLLDAGAGECRFKCFASHLKYISQDFAQYTGEGDGMGLQTGTWDNSKLDLVCDIAAIPLENSSVDNILCSEVFEHIPHPDKAVDEFSRLLKPGGTLLLTAPLSSLTHYAPYHFCTGFNKYWYSTVLTEKGFDVSALQIKGNYFCFLSQEILRFPIIAKKYAVIKGQLSNLFYLLFLFALPAAFIIYLVSLLTKGSENLFGIGVFVVAKKRLL